MTQSVQELSEEEVIQEPQTPEENGENGENTKKHT